MNLNFHSVLFAAGALIALGLYRRLVQADRSAADASLDLLLVFLGGLLGARLLWALWMGGQSAISYVSFWDVGLISWGGILVGGVVGYARLRRQPDRARLLASLLAAVLVGWTVGRLGNFLQGDAYGQVIDGAFGWWYGRIPIQLLEAGVTLGLAVWLGSRLRRTSVDHDIWKVAATYGLARVFIDSWRDLPTVLWGLNGSQMVALGLLSCAIIGLLWPPQTH